MAIAASGAVSFSDLRTEFVGGSSAISFSNLYRGGSNIKAKAGNNTATNLASSVPASGVINFTNFRSTAKAFRKTYTSGATNQNASSVFGDDYGVSYPKQIVIDSGVELGATSTSEEALQIDFGLSGGLTITNNGTLSGSGGSANGGAGGDAFQADVACILINNGTIRGGGGGGGAGGTGGGGQFTTTSTSDQFIATIPNTQNYVSPRYNAPAGTIQVFRTAGFGQLYRYSGGGWSGHNWSPHPASAGQGFAFNGYYTSTSPVYWKIQTSSTTNTNGGGGGAGGRGQGYNHALANGSGGAGGGTNAGSGGTGANGAGYGNSGATGNNGANGNRSNGSGGGGGGAAGKYIRGLSLVTLTQNGTVQGGTA